MIGTVLIQIFSRMPKLESSKNTVTINNKATSSSVFIDSKSKSSENKTEDLSLDQYIRLYDGATTTTNVGSITGTAYTQTKMLVSEQQIVRLKSREEFQIENSYQPTKLVINKEDNLKG